MDAIWCFPDMPDAYHFRLLRAHLQTLQGLDGVQTYDYGSFPAHGGLWAMCEKTKDDIVARMALVPRTLEARGLDATPQIQVKLRKANTQRAQAQTALQPRGTAASEFYRRRNGLPPGRPAEIALRRA